jgi:hypothetical protein
MTLKKINEDLSLLLNNMRKEVQNIDFQQVSTFKIESVDSDINWSEIEVPGIYLIEIKNNGDYSNFKDWIAHFKSLWESNEFYGKYTPSLKLKRIKEHKGLGNWIPIYIGKSKKISGRFHSHIYKGLDKKTFALKLKPRHNLKNETFRLSKIELDTVNYDTVAPIFELEKRNAINPIIGRQ